MKRPNGETIRLIPPRDVHDSERAVQAWLLSLWHLLPKQRHQFLRNRSSLSLELVCDGEASWLQAWSAELPLVDLTRSVFGGGLPGLEVQTDTSSSLDIFVERPGAWSPVRLKWSGDTPLGDAFVDPQPGLLRSLAAGPALVQLLLDAGSIRSRDGFMPGFWLSGRIVCLGPASRRRVAGISGALGQLAGINRLLVRSPRTLSNGTRQRICKRQPLSHILQPGTPATPAQVAALFHFPPLPGSTPGFDAALSVRTPLPPAINSGIRLGDGLDRRATPAPFYLPPESLTRHGLVVGPSGSGKTAFLAQLAREVIRSGSGLTIIDPHGGLVDEIASTLPPGPNARAAIVRFADRTHVVGLNPLASDRGQEAFVADELVELLGRVYGRSGWGPLLELAIRHSAIASAEVGGSLLDSAELLEDPLYRESLLDGVRNPATARFLARLGDAGGLDRRILPAVHRFDRMLSSPLLRASLSLPEQTLDFEQVFRARQILLLDLSGIGQANARVLGSVLLLLIRNATLKRRFAAPLHAVLVDEASLFVSPTIAELLDQARKYQLGLVLAVQRLSQLTPDSLRSAVTANVANLFAFRMLDRDDASTLAKLFADPRLDTADLQGLGRFEAYGRIVNNGAIQPAAWFRAVEPQPPCDDVAVRLESLVKRGQERFMRPRHEIAIELAASRRAQPDEPEIISVEEPNPADAA